MDVLCVGYASYDIFLLVDGFITENRKYSIRRMMTSGGGPAFNAAYLIGKWNGDVGYVGQLGNDRYGNEMMNELQEAGVRSFVVRQSSTSVSSIIVNEQNASRTILNYKEDRKLLQRGDLGSIDDPTVLLFDGHEGDITRSLLKEKNAISIYDAGSVKTHTDELVKLTDYIVSSEVFAQDYFSVNDPLLEKESIIQKISKKKEQGLLKKESIFVITLGSRGLIYEEDGVMHHMPACKVQAVDTTGAGDFFHGAFAYFIAKSYPLQKALQKASEAAAYSITKFGTREAIIPVEKLLEE